jgi:amino-acid N-acetyltransferase
MNGVTFSFAQKDQEQSIRELLAGSELPEEDISPHLSHFIVAESRGAIVGCVGLERAGETALLRSLAVATDFRSKGLGRELCRRITKYARQQGYETLYLLTTSATDYFSAQGYKQVNRSAAPEGIKKTEQFRSLCPSSAVLMKASI